MCSELENMSHLSQPVTNGNNTLKHTKIYKFHFSTFFMEKEKPKKCGYCKKSYGERGSCVCARKMCVCGHILDLHRYLKFHKPTACLEDNCKCEEFKENTEAPETWF